MRFNLSDERVSSRLINLLVDEPATFVYCLDMRTERFVYASRAAWRLLGRRPSELCAEDALPIKAFLVEPRDDEEGGDATIGRTQQVRHVDGSLRWLQTREIVLETDSLGRVVLMLGIGRDVTTRREAASEFGLHKYLLRTLNRIVEAFSVIPADEDVTASINEGLALIGPIVGASRCHLVRIHDRDRLPIKFSITHEFYKATLQPAATNLQHVPVNLTPRFFKEIEQGKPVYLTPDGDLDSDRMRRLILMGDSNQSFVALPLAAGAETWGYFGFVPEGEHSKVWDDDVLSLLRLAGQVFVNRIKYSEAHSQLLESEVRWRQTADAAFDLVLLLDRDLNVIQATSKNLDIHSQFEGTHLSSVFEAGSYRRLRAAISSVVSSEAQVRDLEIQAPDRDGIIVWYRVRVTQRVRGGVLVGTHIFATMIQEQKEAATRISELSRELEHASRLSVLGQMATEIAHELNQPLQVIASYAEGLRLKLASLGADDLDVINLIVDAADDAAQTVRNIREFVHHRVVEVTFVSIEEIVRSAMVLVDPICHQHMAVVEYTVEPDLPPVVVNAAQITHVLLNLVINGIEAAAEDVLLEQISIHIDCRLEDEWIRVTVSDNGPGVPEDKREAIFKRYVTTKKTGLGVGLASSRDVMQRYGGQLILSDAPRSRGAEFVFTLPLAGSETSIESDTSEM